MKYYFGRRTMYPLLTFTFFLPLRERHAKIWQREENSMKKHKHLEVIQQQRQNLLKGEKR